MPFLTDVEYGGSRGNQFYGNIASMGDDLFLFADNNRSIYRISKGECERIYHASDEFVHLRRISQQDGNLYFIQGSMLYKLSLADGAAKPLLMKVHDYDIYGKIAYVQNSDFALYAFETDNPSNSTLLQKNVFGFSAVPEGVIYVLHEGKNYRLYFHNRKTGDIKLLCEGINTNFQVVDDYVYYEDTPSNDEGVINYLIWRVNYRTGEKSILYDQKKISPNMEHLSKFVIHDNVLYLLEDDAFSEFFSKYDIDTDTHEIFMEYTYEPTDKANGVIDLIHLFGLEATDNYIYLNGICYNGEYITTRIPIAGDLEGKYEEVVYNGQWLSPKEYYDEWVIPSESVPD